jgi:hypothetical protein
MMKSFAWDIVIGVLACYACDERRVIKLQHATRPSCLILPVGLLIPFCVSQQKRFGRALR